MQYPETVWPQCPRCRSPLRSGEGKPLYCIECNYKESPEYHEWVRRQKCMDRVILMSRVPSNPISRYDMAKAERQKTYLDALEEGFKIYEANRPRTRYEIAREV